MTFDIQDYLTPAAMGPNGAGIQRHKHETRSILAEVDHLIKQYEMTAIAHSLATYVEDRFQEARQHRANSGVDRAIERATNAYNFRYNPEDMEMVAETSDVYAPLTNTKCRGLRDWIVDILANAEDKPWTLDPTPEPELPPWMEEEIVKRLEMEIMQNGIPEDLVLQVQMMKELAAKHASAIAGEKTSNMERRIHDQMLKSSWRQAFADFVDDLSYMPAAVINGPTVEAKKKLEWRGGQATEVVVPTYTFRRVDPRNFYPAPGSADVASAPYVCEVRTYTAAQLLDNVGLFGVDEQAVKKLLTQNPDGYSLAFGPGTYSVPMGTRGPARLYETIQYVGEVDGRILLEHGIEDAPAHGSASMDLWVCNGMVLRALRNPYPLERKAYHTATFMPNPGSIWGTTLPELIETPQRMANAAIRGLARDIAFTSGPIGEYDIERLVEKDSIDQISPYHLFAVKPDYTSGGAAAIRFQKLASSSPQLTATYERFMKDADDVSGIPAYVIGNPNVAGAGRTLGGLSLLMGNAAKGVKRVIAGIDKGVIEPAVTMLYELNLVYGDDDSIKSDASVVARGATGLLQRELTQARATEVLPLLTNGMQMGLVKPEAIATVMRQILELLGYDADLVEDPLRQMQIMQAIQGGMEGQGMPTPAAAPNSGSSAPVLPPAAPAATLDGRSALPPDPGALQVNP